MALVDLDDPPSWFVKQSSNHWNAEMCRKMAGTQGLTFSKREITFFRFVTGKVELLTNPISCGYVQNPISVYYCFSHSGVLEKCIAEVRISIGTTFKAV